MRTSKPCQVRIVILFVLVLFLALPSKFFAQEGGGILTGTVVDSSGAAISHASVSVHNVTTGQTTDFKTNRTGDYVTPSLPVGNYTVSIYSPQFQPVLRQGIILQTDATVQVNFSLHPGNVNQSITVTEQGNNADVSSAEIGTVFNERAISQLPVNGRSTLALAQLTPGVNRNSGQINEGFADRGTLVSAISINNGPNALNAILLDGETDIETYTGEISINPATDAIGEFKVESGTIPAEYGFTGGGVISMTSASGTNQYHGSIYDFIRNDAFDARSYFNDYPSPVAELRFNQFGASFGGPIGKKTTFFTNYEGFRYLDDSVVITTVPTMAERGGDFSQLETSTGAVTPIYDPSTTQLNPNGTYSRTQFPQNMIRSGDLDPVAANINAFYPLPNHTPNNNFTQTDNYETLSPNNRVMNQALGRIDHTFSPRQTMFVRYAYFKHFTDNGGNTYSRIEPVVGLRNDNDANQSGIIEDTFILTPSLINEARIAVLRSNFTFVAASGGAGWPQKLGLPSDVPPTVFPNISNGEPSFLTGTVGDRAATVAQFSDIMTFVHRNHNMRFGVDYRVNRGYNTQTLNNDASGLFNFGNGLTGNPQSPSGTGNSYASFLLGAASSATVETNQGESEADFSVSEFFEDSWRVVPRFTLNMGLRYDIQTYPTEQNDGLSNFNPNLTDPLGLRGALEFAGVNGAPRSFRNTDFTNLGPRVGFAWDIFGNGKTSLRGGYGIYYPSNFSTIFFGSTAGFASTTTTYSAAGGNSNYPAFYLKNGFPTPPIPPKGAGLGPDGLLGQSVTYDKQNDGTTPMSQQWDLSVQRTLPADVLLDVAYVGNHGTHFVGSSISLNQLNPEYLSLGTALQTPVPNPYAGIVPGSLGAATITRQQSLLAFPYYQGVSLRNPHNADFIGHALEISATRNAGHGLTLIAGYTKSKLIDDGINTPVNYNGVIQATVIGYQNSYDLRANRAVDPLDHSQMLRVSGLYDLPFGAGRRFGTHTGPFLNRIIGGFQLNTATQWQTGLPLTISGANNFTASRPNFIPGVSAKLAHPTIQEWFNTAAFINPPNYTFGDVGRTLPNVRGPGLFNTDISLFKRTPITNRIGTEFRVEAFNAINHPGFGLPSMSFSPGTNGLNASGTFGTITSATDGRDIQLAFKVLF